MKKNGFSLVEMLVAIIIVALLVVILIPGYVTITNQVKRSNYNNKIVHLESETLKYANNFKDDIKDNSCINYTVEQMIEKGLIESDDKAKNELYNPVDGSKFNGYVRVCYCPSSLDITANYVQQYDENKEYYKGEKVIYNGVIYKCLEDAPKNSLFANYTPHLEGNNTTNAPANPKYFKEVEC